MKLSHNKLQQHYYLCLKCYCNPMHLNHFPIAMERAVIEAAHLKFADDMNRINGVNNTAI